VSGNSATVKLEDLAQMPGMTADFDYNNHSWGFTVTQSSSSSSEGDGSGSGRCIFCVIPS